MFLFDAGEAVLDGGLVGLGLRLFPQVLDGPDKEASSATSRVQNCLIKGGLTCFNDKLGDGALGVEFSSISCRLEVSVTASTV